MTKTSPIRPIDNEARDLLRRLMGEATHAALGTVHPDHGAPHVTRIALAMTKQDEAITLISDLSLHAKALKAASLCGLLVGEPGEKGDPLTHPRISLACRAEFVKREHARWADLRAQYLEARPKAKLYADFGDFNFVLFDVQEADLNGGFGKAFRLTPMDLGLA